MTFEILAMSLSSFQYFSKAPMPFFLMSSKMGFNSGSLAKSSSLPDSRSFAASLWMAGLYMEMSSKLLPIIASASSAVVFKLSGFTANCSPLSMSLTMRRPVPFSVSRSSAVGGTTMAFLPLSSGLAFKPLMMTISPGAQARGAPIIAPPPPPPPMLSMPPMPGRPPIAFPMASGPPVASENFRKIMSLLSQRLMASMPFFSTSSKYSFISGSFLSFSTPAWTCVCHASMACFFAGSAMIFASSACICSTFAGSFMYASSAAGSVMSRARRATDVCLAAEEAPKTAKLLEAAKPLQAAAAATAPRAMRRLPARRDIAGAIFGCDGRGRRGGRGKN
mmetsp:Transcript_20249/g.70110  ORF Transcript_20249/g.70110 Transcript_20249/m.70110 type:complete len:335 (-) Transcript_20249:19-1023(-)